MAFDLSSIRSGPELKPPRVLLYGVHGIGKSTFGADAPSPIFIPTEDGLGTINTKSFPLAKSSTDVIQAITTLYQQEHDYQTAVLDSADWLENFMVQELTDTHTSQELSYGKSALLLAEKWREVLRGFDDLRNDKGMAIVVIAHTEIKRFDSPETEPYDRYRPKLQERSSALLQEWADAVLFTNYRVFTKKDDVGFNKSVVRGVGTGERVIYTQETPAYYAKNRYGLPAQLKLNWDDFYNAVVASTTRGE